MVERCPIQVYFCSVRITFRACRKRVGPGFIGFAFVAEGKFIHRRFIGWNIYGNRTTAISKFQGISFSMGCFGFPRAAGLACYGSEYRGFVHGIHGNIHGKSIAWVIVAQHITGCYASLFLILIFFSAH